ncbi:MAG: dihydropteroate synthase [Actinobacteria bacterium]|nr:dihydropteroate synthase [Actinomycetota bacterium]
MITLGGLAALAQAHGEDLGHPVAAVRLGDRTVDTDATPLVMGCVNLSKDSTYRESIALGTDAAIRKGRVLAAHGADLVDVGAESSTARAARVDPQEQADALVPVVEGLVAAGVAVSAEAYDPVVVKAALAAGAAVVNYTGSAADEEVFGAVAAAGATVVLCYVPGADVREVTDVDLDDPFPGILGHFERRVALARSCGVEHLVLDPGMGFYYGNLTDPAVRVNHQMRVLLRSSRLRRLGLPVCQSVPHAFALFGDQFRTAEGFFTVFAALAGVGVVRTHEVAHVRAVLHAMTSLDA